MRSIEKGDIIALVARAEYPAWVNIVKAVELEILYEHETEVNSLIRLVTSSFEYIPLRSASDIRLILVHPGSFDDALNCTLIHSSLASAKLSGFEAISYRWGSSDQTTINLEYDAKKSEFGVHGSVESVLRHLRRNDGQIRTLWIDAVCIDQSNDQERADQVALMADIYSMADAVNVWLGASDHITQLAFRVIHDIYNCKKNLCPGGAECTCPGTAHTMTRKDFQNLDNNLDAITQFHLHREPDQTQDQLRNVMQSSHTLISELFGNPWFKRVWVLQEVINSKRAVLHCGAESILWKELVEVNDYHNHQLPHLVPLHRLPQIWSHLGKPRNPSVFPSISDSGEERPEAARDIGILDVVLEALELDSTDPRDKIFALLSFGKETKIISHLPELIKPDYKKSIDRVFADFTRWWIKEHKSLRILSMIHGNIGRTWQGLHCPFEEPPVMLRPTWTLRTEGMHGWSIATLDSQFEFRASGDSVPDYETISNSFNSNPLHLHLLGYKITQIEDLSHFLLPEQTTDTASLFEVYLTIFGRWKNPSLSRHDILQRISEHLRAHWQYEWKEFLSLLKMKSIRKEDKSGYERVLLKSAFPCNGPCFFVATDGSTGLCLAGARKGDRIAILLGGNVPFLLRDAHATDKGDQHFELIGECYVEGKMHGEFVREQESINLNAEHIILV